MAVFSNFRKQLPKSPGILCSFENVKKRHKDGVKFNFKYFIAYNYFNPKLEIDQTE